MMPFNIFKRDQAVETTDDLTTTLDEVEELLGRVNSLMATVPRKYKVWNYRNNDGSQRLELVEFEYTATPRGEY